MEKEFKKIRRKIDIVIPLLTSMSVKDKEVNKAQVLLLKLSYYLDLKIGDIEY